MRGARTCPNNVPFSPGIIPAYAGSTVRACPRPPRAGDHPRICGEHGKDTINALIKRGSSPRMRGALERRVLGVAVDGIIPAYARSTSVRPSTPRGAGDHPRVCGEHMLPKNFWMPPTGSSPRMRGALHAAPALGLRGGIIPAYAGSTGAPSGRPRGAGDHPRVCGGHLSATTVNGYHQGSSPRMRGAPERGRKGAQPDGIIPAYAGSTAGRRMTFRTSRDHPRACGEHNTTSRSTPRSLGSPPRMRGAPLVADPVSRRDGIIPAYAGSTATPTGPGSLPRDHPRVCGEHYGSDGHTLTLTGSSPRMRGAL